MWWIRLIVGPLFISSPPAAIAGFYGNVHAKTMFIASFPPIGQFFIDHDITMASLSLLWPIVILAIGTALLERAQARIIPLDSMLRIDAAIDSVVGCKEQRFLAHAATNELTKETAF